MKTSDCLRLVRSAAQVIVAPAGFLQEVFKIQTRVISGGAEKKLAMRKAKTNRGTSRLKTSVKKSCREFKRRWL